MAIGESIIHQLPKRLRWNGQHYFIYALIDPRDNVARYIGMSKDAEFRFYQHLISACSLNTLHWIEG